MFRLILGIILTYSASSFSLVRLKKNEVAVKEITFTLAKNPYQWDTTSFIRNPHEELMFLNTKSGILYICDTPIFASFAKCDRDKNNYLEVDQYLRKYSPKNKVLSLNKMTHKLEYYNNGSFGYQQLYVTLANIHVLYNENVASE